jgi:SAM-dependent methyltransferase
MARNIDALASPTLKHLRDRWWDSDFATFLRDTLRPRPGNRILDVGCGDGAAELSLGRLQISQVALFAVDRRFDRVKQTKAAGAAHNIKLHTAAADALDLPFASNAFDAVFCVAVLQHVPDVGRAVEQLARVTKPGGRIVAVEPDNGARYWFSSSESGRRAFEAASRFFARVGEIRGDSTDPAVGPNLPARFAAADLDLLSIDLFPVSVARMGPAQDSVWEDRREALEALLGQVDDPTARQLGEEYRAVLDRYEADSKAAGKQLVEIQNTMLFGVVGQKGE